MIYELTDFIEKPNEKNAKTMISKGNYFGIQGFFYLRPKIC